MEWQKFVDAGIQARFFGVDNTHFKIGDWVFEVQEDENDGYRSTLGAIEEKEVGNLIFFKTPLDVVKVVVLNNIDGFALVSVIDGHEWLRFGTDWADDYYPMCVFDYTPRKPRPSGPRP